MFVALLDLMDGKKTYLACIFAIAVGGVCTFYLGKMEVKEFVEICLFASIFIFKRMGSKSDAAKIIAATEKQIEKAIAITPCSATETKDSLDKAVDSIINTEKNQN